MSRIPGIQDQQVGFIVDRILKVTNKLRGAVPEPLRLMAKIGEDKLKALARVKVSSMVGCVF
ncbi:MAG: hypothetical protein ABGX04_17915 [Myxococcales bacterium]|nr:hypothetical protein [Myxococcales bacterium]HIK84138.1 hypothetical protein [Myxococcales bacterium]